MNLSFLLDPNKHLTRIIITVLTTAVTVLTAIQGTATSAAWVGSLSMVLQMILRLATASPVGNAS